MKKPGIGGLLFFIYLSLLPSCKKDFPAGTRDQTTFIELLSRDSSHAIVAMNELQNHSYLLVENWYDGQSCDLVWLEKGGKLNKRDKMDVPGSGSGQWKSLKLRSGDIVFTQVVGDYMLKYSQDGTLLFKKKLMLDNEQYGCGAPVETADGSILVPMITVSFGGYIGKLVRVDSDGNVVARLNVDLGSNLRSLLTLEIADQRGDTLHLLASSVPFFVDMAKAKLTSMIYPISTGIVSSLQLFDEHDSSESDYIINAYPTQTGVVCLTSGNMNYTLPSYNPSPEFELFFLDHTGAIIKRKRYALGVYNAVPSKIVPTSDHGFLICGHINSTRTDHFFGMMMKLDAQGNVESSRVFDETQLVLFDCLETQDGNFLFGGATLSFGSGKDYVDAIVLKTDRKGLIN